MTMTNTTNTTNTTTATAGSDIVKALETAYKALRANHPELPDLVIITGTGLMARGAKWGHLGAERWVAGNANAADGAVRMHELFIAGERLACGAQDTFQTLVHEAVHALARVRGIKEVSRDNRYHNRKFVTLSEELGLEFPADQQPHGTIGYSAVVLTADTIAEYADVIADLDATIVAHLDTFKGWNLSGKGTDAKGTEGDTDAPPVKPAPLAKRNNDKATCDCDEPRIIRASKKVLAEAPIICGICEGHFTVK